MGTEQGKFACGWKNPQLGPRVTAALREDAVTIHLGNLTALSRAKKKPRRCEGGA